MGKRLPTREERLRFALDRIPAIRGAILDALGKPTDANVDLAVEQSHHLRIDLYGAQHAER